YSDFLLHDIETGDGIVQAGPQDTANKLRTAPLWGLRMRPRFTHDLRWLSLQNAIERHAGEAEHVRQRFQELSPVEKQPLLSFLNSCNSYISWLKGQVAERRAATAARRFPSARIPRSAAFCSSPLPGVRVFAPTVTTPLGEQTSGLKA